MELLVVVMSYAVLLIGTVNVRDARQVGAFVGIVVVFVAVYGNQFVCPYSKDKTILYVLYFNTNNK